MPSCPLESMRTGTASFAPVVAPMHLAFQIRTIISENPEAEGEVKESSRSNPSSPPQFEMTLARAAIETACATTGRQFSLTGPLPGAAGKDCRSEPQARVGRAGPGDPRRPGRRPGVCPTYIGASARRLAVAALNP